MSKEMLVIALGAWIIVVRVVLGVPGSWQTALFILSGIALMITGFLLRGEAIKRSMQPRGSLDRRGSYSFVDTAHSTGSGQAAPSLSHEHQEGITSLN